MENRGSIQQTESERRCQIEGCNDVTVGARTSLCRKHRNNKYKQNYKKRKRKAQGVEENQGESLESQLAVEKYHLEQKYASMLQQVLVQKRLELLQSPSIRSLLRIHQQTVRENKQKELMEKRKTAHNERSSKLQQEKQSKLQSTSEPSSSCANTNTTCNSGATTKSTSSPSKAASSNKTLSKSSKQSSRPSQGRNVSKNSKHRNNSNSSIESSVNGLASNLKIASSNNNNSIGHPVYGSTGAWATEKSEFCDLRHVQNFQQQQMTSQEILHHPIQQALQQQNLQQQPQPPPPPPPQQQQQQRQVSNSLQPELLLQLYQQHNMQKQQLQHLQRPNLLEHLHQKQLHERQEKEKQQQLQLQQQQRLSEQLVQQQQQQQQFVQQQRRLQQQQQQHQQQQQQELRLQLQNSRQQQQQQYKHQQMQQQQQQQQQQLQHQKGTGHQTRHQVQLPQQQQQHQHLLQQHQTCASSVTQSVNHVSSTEILFQNLPSIQSSISNLLVSQSHINTSNHDVNSSAAISTTTRHSVLPRTILTNTQGRTQNCTPINHMVSNTPSVTSHRPIAPRLEGHPNVNNTLCNAGMPIITAIISAPLTQQIMPQNASNVERNSIQPGTESNVLTSINSFGNPLTNHYPLMPFNTQMDMNLLQ